MDIMLEIELRDALDLHTVILDGYRKEQQYRLGLLEIAEPNDVQSQLIVEQAKTLERLERVWANLNAKLELKFPTLEQFWLEVDASK